MPRLVPSRLRRISARGYVLFDALVAVVLLAGALLGTAMALVQSLASSRASALQTAAVDLAADLGEALQAEPAADTRGRLLAEWSERAQHSLPSAAISALPAPSDDPGASASGLEVKITWRDIPASGPFTLHLPIVPPSADPQP